MRIDITKPECEVIISALKGTMLRADTKLREQLAQRLDWQLHPSKAPDKNGWAPIKRPSIRSSWPSGHVNPDRKSHWSYKRRPKDKKPSKPKAVKKVLTADDILAEL